MHLTYSLWYGRTGFNEKLENKEPFVLLSTGLSSRAQSEVLKGEKEDFEIQMKDLIQTQA